MANQWWNALGVPHVTTSLVKFERVEM